VGLADAADKSPATLRWNETAGFNRTSRRPKVLILDEVRCDEEELQEELLKIWNDHRCTVLTHDIDEALFLADRLVMMTNGPAAKIGEVMETLSRPRDRDRIGRSAILQAAEPALLLPPLCSRRCRLDRVYPPLSTF